jgi:eukaryotic-like serine/threonine-protein kinase
MSLTTVDGRYQVTARIASGGMGEVYRARDGVLARDVAIKVLHPNLAGDAGFIDRFRREARSAALLSHPNIVAVHDWGSTNGTYFMVMEFVRGRNLRDLLTAYRRLEPAQAADVLVQMLAALEHAHRRGIVHRDIKPENVLVTADGHVKVADFGLARAFAESRITQAPGTVTGTVQYLAPEQIQGEPADPRTDLYALGVVAYELLTGQVPFTGETSLAIAYKHLSDRVPAPSKTEPSVPPELDRLVLRATEKDREHRPSSAAELRRELVHVSASLPEAGPLPELVRGLPPTEAASPEERAATVTIPRMLAPRARRRRRLRALSAIVLILAILGGGAWATWTFIVHHYTTVPSVLGLPVEQARARLEQADLDVEIGASISSTEYDPGEVANQSVAGGLRVRTRTDILLRPSQGLPLIEVPSLSGKNRPQAERALNAVDLALGDVSETYHDRIPVGNVIDQNPVAGTTIQFGSSVNITISLGPEPVQVPNVVGLTEDEAGAVLSAQELTVEVREEYSIEVSRGEVIRQEPAADTSVDRESVVTIFVSLGPQQFDMPGVIGESRDAGEALLRALGLIVRVIEIPGSNADMVVGQNPGSGTTVEAGDTVTIYVA